MSDNQEGSSRKEAEATLRVLKRVKKFMTDNNSAATRAGNYEVSDYYQQAIIYMNRAIRAANDSIHTMISDAAHEKFMKALLPPPIADPPKKLVVKKR